MNAQKLGQRMELKLLEPFDVVILSRWAYQIYLDNLRDITGDLQDVLLDLSRMGDGVEFEYSEEEVRVLARGMLTR